MSWELKGESTTTIAAAPEAVYDLVADVTRMGEWSPECTGGEWTNGSGEEGSTFNGHNEAGGNTWTTPNTVLIADRPNHFQWTVGTKDIQANLWGFKLEAADDGTKVTQYYELGAIDVGFRQMVNNAPEADRDSMIETRRETNARNMAATLEKIKAAAEGA